MKDVIDVAVVVSVVVVGSVVVTVVVVGIVVVTVVVVGVVVVSVVVVGVAVDVVVVADAVATIVVGVVVDVVDVVVVSSDTSSEGREIKRNLTKAKPIEPKIMLAFFFLDRDFHDFFFLLLPVANKQWMII